MDPRLKKYLTTHYELHPKAAFLFLKWLSFIIIYFLIITSVSNQINFSQGVFLLVVFFIFNLILFFIPSFKLFTIPLSYIIFFVDILIVSAAIYISSGIDSDFYLVYFLVIFISALSQNIASTILVTAISALIYITLAFKTSGDFSVLEHPAFWLRIPFFFLVAFFSSFLVDIVAKERKKLETMVLTSQKLISLGEMVAEIVHEIRDPLHTLGAFVKLLDQKISEDDTRKELIKVIKKEATRVSQIVRNISELFTKTRGFIKSADINNLIEEVVTISKNNLAKHKIRLLLRLSPNLPLIKVNPEQIKEVFLNLLVNAIHAMPEGGELRIASFRENGWLKVKFEDTGCGIPPEELPQIFKPFFSTKEKGSGLGLSIASKIIDIHHGKIEVKSTLKKGTTFTIFLPIWR
jgi:signal transduction histidine kinase